VRVVVIGVGTGHGDDAAGLAVADALAGRALPLGVEVRRCERPLPDLLDALAGAEAAIVVDALPPARAPGRVRRVARAELLGGAPASSHGLGVASALALAASLGRAPERIELLGIEAAVIAPLAGLSHAVRAAVPRAANAALRRARHHARAGRRADTI
jgi:hydrogenase maturation protease